MRRIVPLLGVWLACLLALPAGSAEVEPTGGEQRFAGAVWMRPTADPKVKTGYLVIAHDQRGLDGPGMWSILIVAKGRCEKQGKRYTCEASQGRGYRIRPDDLEIDPAMGSATVSVKRGGFHHRVSWTAEGTPGYGWSMGWGGDGLEWQYREVGVAVARMASASGTLFGERVPARIQDGSAAFSRGPYAGFDYWNPDGPVRFGHVTFDL